MLFTLIYTRTDKWLISKEEIDCKAWQDKLYWFVTSLSFGNSSELASFLIDDFHLNKQSQKYIIASLSGSSNTYEICIDNKDIEITPLQVDPLNSEGEVIDWQDWSYFFTKVSNKYKLWVYLGGTAEQVREIILSSIQVEEWKGRGNSFIKELVTDLQHPESKIYADAINENRKVL